MTAQGRVFWAEFEAPDAPPAPTRARVYWAELETPDVQSVTGIVLPHGIVVGGGVVTASGGGASVTATVTAAAIVVGGGVVTGTPSIGPATGIVLTGAISVGGGIVSASDGSIAVSPPEEDSVAQIFGGALGVSVLRSDSAVAVAASESAGGPRITETDDGLGGGATITTVIYRATAANVWLEDISDRVEGGSIVVDTSQAVPMTFQAETTEPDVLTAYQDWIAPVMTYRYPDPVTGTIITERNQLGLYLVMPSTKTYTAAQGIEAIDGRDALWLLSSSGPGEPWSRASGQNVGIAMETVCNLAGARYAIQTTSQTLPKRRTWPWNATWLQIANDLARSIGYVPLWTDRTGRVRSQRFRTLGNIEPARFISHRNRSVLETVRLEPDLTRLCNHVVVVGNDPKGNPVIAERLNNDPDSETSTVRLGSKASPRVIQKFIEDPNLTDQDAVDQIADRTMDEGSSVLQRITVTTPPDGGWQIGDVSLLDIETDTGLTVAGGRYRWDRLQMGLGVDATVTFTFSKLAKWAQVD